MKRLITLLFTLLALALPAQATWSIVVVNKRTGEVAVASATCLSGFNLEKYTPVVIVGTGGAAVQSRLDVPISSRLIIRDSFLANMSPPDILDLLEQSANNFQGHQYGIASFDGLPVSHNGTNVGDAKPLTTGVVGDLMYAIQGNVLAGDAVVANTEIALVSAPGDLSQKVMAAMEAARAMGGDGRCSCGSTPTSCGAPPPSFTKSAHVGYIIVARIGDTDGDCTQAAGCALGSYYLNLNIVDTANDPDPVLTMQLDYDAWRAGLSGRPDQQLSRVTPGATRLPADGVSSTEVVVQLVDVDGLPLIGGGATVSVGTVDGQPPLATPGAVTDLGNGSYSFPLSAGTTAGSDAFAIVVDDGISPVTLWPYLEVEVADVQPLTVGLDEVSALSGGSVPFVLNVPAAALGGYAILGSASGTSPGVAVGPVLLPLNPDNLFLLTANQANSALLPGSVGVLDGNGRSEASFVPPPGLLANFIGMRFDWAALHISPALGVTNAVGFEIVE